MIEVNGLVFCRGYDSEVVQEPDILIDINATWGSVSYSATVGLHDILYGNTSEEYSHGEKLLYHVLSTKVKDTRNAEVPPRYLMEKINEAEVVAAIEGILAWIKSDRATFQTVLDRCVCAHPGNRAFAARVMAGLSAGL